MIAPGAKSGENPASPMSFLLIGVIGVPGLLSQGGCWRQCFHVLLLAFSR